MGRDGLWLFVGEHPLAELRVGLFVVVTRLRQFAAAHGAAV